MIDWNKAIVKCRELEKYDDLVQTFTMKPYDFNSLIDTRKEMDDQVDMLLNDLGIANYDYVSVKQNHSTNIKVLKNIADKISDDYYDGIITNLRRVVLGIKVADCQAILFYDPVRKVIGNVHSGWRGTIDMIALKAISLMKKEFGSKSEDILCYIGPSIGKCHFEVDFDVYSKFLERFSEVLNFDNYVDKKNNKYYIDTISLNRDLLIKNGLLEKNIFISELCTFCNSDRFHSYRVFKDKAGRNLMIVAMK